MIIGVISDTHIQSAEDMLPQKVHEIFQGVDMIIHAGDILIEEVIIELETIAPVYIVAGNNDNWLLHQKYGTRKLLTVNHKKIGITHGYGRKKTFLNAYAEFLDEKVDCIVYGHSHAPHNEIIDGVLFFNPGSPTNKRVQAQYSVGLLHVNEEITGVIIPFDVE